MADGAEDAGQEHRKEELVKLSFELFKHLTTLSTAASLVVLAVYQEITFERALLGATLSLFGLTVLVCVVSMLAGISYFSNRADKPAAEPTFVWLATVASASFVAGVEAFLLFLINLPYWAGVVAGALLLLGLGFLLRRSFRLRKQVPPPEDS